MVEGGTQNQKVMSSNPSTGYWIDIFYINLLSKLSCLFEKDKELTKNAEDDHLQKIMLMCVLSKQSP